MNSIQEINRINQRELELGLTGKGSWHHQYSDSAYVHVGGLSFEMTEGDVLAVMSQWGEIMDINMPRDKETGKPRGFAFIMYEDQRSTVLAVDNMNGALVLGRMLKVDHVHKYEQPGKRDEEGKYQKPEEPTYNAMPPELSGSDDSSGSESEEDPNFDADDPMAAFLRDERRKNKPKKLKDGDSKEAKRRRKEERRRKREEKERKRLVKELRAKEKGKGVKREREREDEGEGSRAITKSPRRERERSPEGRRRGGEAEERDVRDGRREERPRSRDRRDEGQRRRSRDRSERREEKAMSPPRVARQGFIHPDRVAQQAPAPRSNGERFEPGGRDSRGGPPERGDGRNGHGYREEGRDGRDRVDRDRRYDDRRRNGGDEYDRRDRR